MSIVSMAIISHLGYDELPSIVTFDGTPYRYRQILNRSKGFIVNHHSTSNVLYSQKLDLIILRVCLCSWLRTRTDYKCLLHTSTLQYLLYRMSTNCEVNTLLFFWNYFRNSINKIWWVLESGVCMIWQCGFYVFCWYSINMSFP